ncbi:MAG: NADH-quinone oxidoreductase subunit I [Candidatus Diapherotrites archaeon]|nr:NADH-quinone oxidoreductase subunit I [Candidatus Diapherotrites archaeon]
MKVGVVKKVLGNLIKKPMTVKFPDESIPIADGYRGEHNYDISKCISCGLCARICPNKAIEMVEAPEGYKDKYPKRYPQVDLGKCCFCGLCQDICPTSAIELTKNFFLATFDSTTLIKSPIKKAKDK